MIPRGEDVLRGDCVRLLRAPVRSDVAGEGALLGNLPVKEEKENFEFISYTRRSRTVNLSSVFTEFLRDKFQVGVFRYSEYFE